MPRMPTKAPSAPKPPPALHLQTVERLSRWLVEAPRTRLEILCAAGAPAEDVLAAIAWLVVNDLLMPPALEGDRFRYRPSSRDFPQHLAGVPIVGTAARWPLRGLTRRAKTPWLDEAAREAAQLFRPSPTSDSLSNESFALDAVRGERHLTALLGRVPDDRELRVFWNEVDKAVVTGAPIPSSGDTLRTRARRQPAF